MAKAKSETNVDPTVEELKALLAEQTKANEDLMAQLADAEAKKEAALKAPDGVKYTKKAPDGDLGSDGKGNLVKFVNPSRLEKNGQPTELVKELETEGWKAA